MNLVFARSIVVGGETVGAGTSIDVFRSGRSAITDAWIADAVRCGHLVVATPAPLTRPEPPLSTRSDVDVGPDATTGMVVRQRRGRAAR